MKMCANFVTTAFVKNVRMKLAGVERKISGARHTGRAGREAV